MLFIDMLFIITSSNLLVLKMNEASIGRPEGLTVDGRDGIHLLPVAIVADGEKEVSQLESDRVTLFMGMRAGARRVMQLFLPAMIRSQQDTMARGKHTADQMLLHESIVEDLVDMMLPLSILDRQVTHDDYEDTITVQSGVFIA